MKPKIKYNMFCRNIHNYILVMKMRKVAPLYPIFYQRESRIYLFSLLWIYNDLYVITSHKSISLNFLMKKYFWTPYWLVKFKSTCSLLLLFQNFKFCIRLNINQIESIMVSKWNLNKIWIYFIVFLFKIVSFFTPF